MKRKISYKDYERDIYSLYLRSSLNYTSFEKFIEYARNTDRFDDELGYSYKDVEINNDKT